MVSLADDERYTFSSLMTLLIECEEKLEHYYQLASTRMDDPQLGTLLTDYSKEISRSVQSMRRTRIETVVEMALEPITDLKLAQSVRSIDGAIEVGKAGYLHGLMTMEGAVSQLYLQASPKIANISAEASELLMKLSRDSLERVHKLEQALKH